MPFSLQAPVGQEAPNSDNIPFEIITLQGITKLRYDVQRKYTQKYLSILLTFAPKTGFFGGNVKIGCLLVN